MAIAHCRECGAEVSTEAVVCPHCGVRDPAGTGVVDEHARADRAYTHEHARQRRRGCNAGWIVAALLLLVLLALFLLWRYDIVNFV